MHSLLDPVFGAKVAVNRVILVRLLVRYKHARTEYASSLQTSCLHNSKRQYILSKDLYGVVDVFILGHIYLQCSKGIVGSDIVNVAVLCAGNFRQGSKKIRVEDIQGRSPFGAIEVHK